MTLTSLFRGAAGRLFMCFAFGPIGLRAVENADVFQGPPAAYANPLVVSKPPTDRPLRTLSVEERVGIARDNELVRVPLFFGEGECAALDEIAIVAVPSGPSTSPIPFQADDVRRGPDGGISRVHLWFAVSLKPGEKRRFEIVRRPASSASAIDAAAPIAVAKSADSFSVKTESGAVTFRNDGALRAISGSGADWQFDDEGAFPSAVVTTPAVNGRPAARTVLDRTTAQRSVEWSAGPLFAKVRIKLGDPAGVSLVQEYRIPRNGREMVITRTVFPTMAAGAEIKANPFLEGTLKNPDGPATLQAVPAGIRFELRGEHAYSVTALTRSNAALLAVPLVIGGGNGNFEMKEPGGFSLRARGGLQRGGEGEKATLYAYWSEVRLVPTRSSDPVALWEAYRAHVQPLVAVVEENGATADRLHEALMAIAWEMKPVGWRQDAGRLFMAGDVEKMKKMVPRTAAAKEANLVTLVAGAENSKANITKNGQRPLREDEKGRAYGALDPYHITYTQSAAAAIATLSDAPPGVNAVNLAMASGVRQVGGKTDAAGYPYIDCFSRTLNMQLGPVLFGLTAGRVAGNVELERFYRDLVTAPPVQGVFGRAQRPYTGAQATSPDQTDFLYQAICDFWLRTTEVLAGDNLHLHPLAFARYTDCVDVMADVYHGVASRDKDQPKDLARANFFRGQAHTHRWLGWSCAPFIRLLEDPAEHGAIGLTEAIHFTDAMKGRWKNWPDLTFYILTDLLMRHGLERAKMPTLPAVPRDVSVRRNGSQAEIAWSPVSGAAEYRVYRAVKPGGPHTWMNSPYGDKASKATTTPSFTDPQSPAGATYVVTAVDADGRESSWSSAP